MRVGKSNIGTTRLFKTKEAKKKLTPFNKVWKPGERFRCIYPIFFDEENQEYDILAGAIWGYNWDVNATSLKRVFIKAIAPIDDNGNPEYKDELAQLVPIARLLYKGQERREIKDIEDNTRMKEAAKITAIEKIKIAYNGDSEGKNREHQPLIGSLDYKIFTECLMIPVDENDIPDFSKAIVVSQDLSKDKTTAIKAAINDKKCYVDEELSVAEIAWNFVQAQTKGVSSLKTAPVAVEQAQALLFADETATEAKKAQKMATVAKVKQIAEDFDSIVRRNMNSRDTNITEVIQAFKDYCTTNYKAFEALDSEEDIELAEKNIANICRYEIPVSAGPIAELMDEYIAEQEAKAKEIAEAGEGEATEGAPTVQELIKQEASGIEKYTEEELNAIKENASEGLGDMTVDAGLPLDATATEGEGTDIANM